MKNKRHFLRESALENTPKVDHYCGEEDIVMADAKEESIKKEEEINRRFKRFDEYKKGFTGSSDDKRPIKDDGTSKVAKEELDESLFVEDSNKNDISDIAELLKNKLEIYLHERLHDKLYPTVINIEKGDQLNDLFIDIEVPFNERIAYMSVDYFIEKFCHDNNLIIDKKYVDRNYLSKNKLHTHILYVIDLGNNFNKEDLYESLFKAKNLLEDYDDGWEPEIIDILGSILPKISRLEYEVNSCTKGAYSQCKTPVELADYVDDLATNLSNTADQIRDYFSSNLDESFNLNESDDKQIQSKVKMQLRNALNEFVMRELPKEIENAVSEYDKSYKPDWNKMTNLPKINSNISKLLSQLAQSILPYYFKEVVVTEATQPKIKLSDTKGTIANIFIKHKDEVTDTHKSLDELKSITAQLLKDNNSPKDKLIKDKLQRSKSVVDFISYVYNIILAGDGQRAISNRKLYDSLKESLDYDRFKSDLYNTLADLFFKYRNDPIDEDDFLTAIDWFVDKFFHYLDEEDMKEILNSETVDSNSLKEARTVKNKSKLFPTLYDEVMQRLVRASAGKTNEEIYKGIYDEEADLGISLESIPNDREIGITVNAYFDDAELDWARKVAEKYDLYTEEKNITTPKVYDTDPIKQLIIYVDTTEECSPDKVTASENLVEITPYREARDEIIAQGKEEFEASGGKIDTKGKGIWKPGYQSEEDKEISREMGYKIKERKPRAKKSKKPETEIEIETTDKEEVDESFSAAALLPFAPHIADTVKGIAPSVADVMKNTSDNRHETARYLGGKLIDKIGSKKTDEELLNEDDLEECDSSLKEALDELEKVEESEKDFDVDDDIDISFLKD